MSSLHIIYASTSGHTEHVVTVLAEYVKQKGVEVEVQKAEEAEAEDLMKGDFLVLASGTWNDGGVEGQLNMHMANLLNKRAADLDLAEKKCALISLGDDRYYYTARATEHLMQYFMNHNGKNSCPPLLIINEPFGQEEKVTKWGDQLLEAINS